MAVSKSLRFQILRRDNHACRYCGRSAPEAKLTVDHVVPEALGGSDDPSNLAAACSDCNGGKSATPPDAGTVAQVADDAERWSRAMAAAAEEMLAGRQIQQKGSRTFRKHWDQLSDRFDIPLPANWENTIDHFVAVGLPLPVLLEAATTAHSNRRIATKDVFRYMCGIAWSRVTELQEAAHKLVSTPKPAVDDEEGEGETTWEDLLVDATNEALHSDEAREKAEADVREILQYTERTIESESDMELAVAAHVIESLGTSARLMHIRMRYVLDVLPLDLGDQINDASWNARSEAESGRDALGSTLAAIDFAVDGIADYLAEQYLSTLAAGEREFWISAASEWIDIAPFHGSSTVEQRAVHLARMLKERKHAPNGMCVFDDRGICGSRATYRGWLESCKCGGEKCDGHDVACDKHLSKLAAYPNSSYGPIPEPVDPWAVVPAQPDGES